MIAGLGSGGYWPFFVEHAPAIHIADRNAFEMRLMRAKPRRTVLGHSFYCSCFGGRERTEALARDFY